MPVLIDALEIACGGSYIVCLSAFSDAVPDFDLTLFRLRLLAHIRQSHRAYRYGLDTIAVTAAVDMVALAEVLAARPSAVFDAEDINRYRLRCRFNDAVVADDAILLAADDHLTGNQDELFAGMVGHCQPVDFGVIVYAALRPQAVRAPVGTQFGDDHFAAAQAFIEGDEIVITCGLFGKNRKDRQVIETCRRADAPVTMRRFRVAAGL